MSKGEQLKKIEVVEYDANWPKIFEDEKNNLQNILGSELLGIHHVGSTSVPGLCAKSIIDIIAVVKNRFNCVQQLKLAKYNFKGEINIPFKSFYSKKEPYTINLHIFEADHPEIELNLKFRDYLRNNIDSLLEYANLKRQLLDNPASFIKKENSIFSGYNLGKDIFIRNILEKLEFNRTRFIKVSHNQEWDSYHRIKKEQIFDSLNIIYDSQHPTITHENHIHLALCEGMNVVSIIHIEKLNLTESAIRVLATDKSFQNKGFAKYLMQLTEKWLKEQNIKTVKLHANPKAELFYRRLGYKDCIWDDISIITNSIDLYKELFIKS